MNSSRSAYSGRTRKIVLAFDVGTTFSGISYRWSFLSTLVVKLIADFEPHSILDPGQSPGIKAVTRYRFI